ncbi:hypothetical protein GH714_039470 [Hevea brasiliensis]|uniref:Selenoprotein O n=1 Tax=Hevea brasiliensis TaxID=3981 RepID=A0A6A6MWY0_HEVBR|nr:hypothetical protein GH714_039470 [Hevea brasiliensis]
MNSTKSQLSCLDCRFERPDFPLLFSGATPLVGALPYAQCYGGHEFGMWLIHASRGKEDLDIVCALADYAIRHHFPHIENMSKSESLYFSTGNQDHSVVDLTSNKYAAWTVEAAERTASLVASWQGFGLTHGVLNTDNMSIWGLTIDYGPFGFLDAFDPSYTPNPTDLPVEDKVDYTNFFRLLSNIKAGPNIPEDELIVPLKAVLLDIGKERKEA